jgi:hypothetical protein
MQQKRQIRENLSISNNFRGKTSLRWTRCRARGNHLTRATAYCFSNNSSNSTKGSWAWSKGVIHKGWLVPTLLSMGPRLDPGSSNNQAICSIHYLKMLLEVLKIAIPSTITRATMLNSKQQQNTILVTAFIFKTSIVHQVPHLIIILKRGLPADSPISNLRPWEALQILLSSNSNHLIFWIWA